MCGKGIMLALLGDYKALTVGNLQISQSIKNQDTLIKQFTKYYYSNTTVT